MKFFGIGFLILVFLEVMSIVWMADWLGGGLTFLLMVVSFFFGVMMLRHIGLSAALMAGTTLRSQKDVSVYQLLWPIRYAVAAVLLLSPGFASTVLAAGLMLPFKGKPVANVGGGSFEVFRTHTPRRENDDDVIEGEYTVEDDDDAESKPIDYIEHKR